MYGQRKTNDIDEARYNKLMQLSGKVDVNNPLANVKRVDCALLPPCQRTLDMKVQRTKYVTTLWTEARTARPAAGMLPVEYGWHMDNGILEPIWFKGPAMPDNLFENDSSEIDNEDETEEIYNESDDEAWSDDSDLNDESDED